MAKREKNRADEIIEVMLTLMAQDDEVKKADMRIGIFQLAHAMYADVARKGAPPFDVTQAGVRFRMEVVKEAVDGKE